MASIEKRSGKYRARITRAGHPIYSKTFTRKVDAERWSRETEIAIETGELPIPSPGNEIKKISEPKFCEISEHYAKLHSPHKRNMRSEIGIIKILEMRWSDRLASDVRKSDVLALRDELKSKGRSNDTVNHYLSAISVIYRTASAELFEGLINPAAGVKRMPQGKGRTLRLSQEARAFLLQRCSESSNRLLYPVVFLALETGMRRGELLSIEWQDVDLISRRILVKETKNGCSRTIPLTILARDLLQSLRNNHQITKVFPINEESLRKHFERTVRRSAKLWEADAPNPFPELRFHDLRHEALSHLSDRGLNVIELAQISGHKTLRMLQRYTHPSHGSILQKLDSSEPRISAS